MILHVDLDAFYASVEELDNPSLRGKPLAVGGLSDHGIVTTANYVARKYGIHSAMPLFQARQRCPNLIVVPVRRRRYLEKSREVFDILRNYSPVIEQVSIDEGYLDISHWRGNLTEKVYRMKGEIRRKTGLTVSVGMSWNKFLAKIASDWKKPDGFMIISKGDLPDILLPLPVEKIHGIGPKSATKLRSLGIETVGELMDLPREYLGELFGKWGYEIYDRIRGKDLRPVEPVRERKSIGVERTFDVATEEEGELLEYLEGFCEELEGDLLRKKFRGYTVTVKVKTASFQTYTRSRTLPGAICRKEDLFDIGRELLGECPKGEPYRLLGITLSGLEPLAIEQLSFLEEDL